VLGNVVDKCGIGEESYGGRVIGFTDGMNIMPDHGHWQMDCPIRKMLSCDVEECQASSVSSHKPIESALASMNGLSPTMSIDLFPDDVRVRTCHQSDACWGSSTQGTLGDLIAKLLPGSTQDFK
jgi:hypothetical protein